MPVLDVVLASTRPGRVGKPVADWFVTTAEKHGGFDVRLVDLAELALPFMDEPNHPRLRDYQHDHTKAWSAIVDEADAFVFVTPEYNHGFNAVLKNALDFLNAEWALKPAGIVSYGGVAAGTRAAEMLQAVLSALEMHTLALAVHIPFVAQFLDADRTFVPNDVTEAAATAMLDELERFADHFAALRA